MTLHLVKLKLTPLEKLFSTVKTETGPKKCQSEECPLLTLSVEPAAKEREDNALLALVYNPLIPQGQILSTKPIHCGHPSTGLHPPKKSGFAQCCKQTV